MWGRGGGGGRGAFTRLGHERQDLLSPWNACVHRLDLGLQSHPKEFLGNGVKTMLTPRGKSPVPEKKFPVGWALNTNNSFLFFYLHLFSTIEHVSHEKAL